MSRTLPLILGVLSLAACPREEARLLPTTPAAPRSQTGDGGAPPAPEGRDTEPDAKLVELRLDEAIVAGEGLVLTWTKLEDSRCPIGVTCVWAGEAVVTVLAVDGGASSELELRLGPRGEGPVATTRHSLRLTDVSPHPRDGESTPRSELRATVSIVRR